MSTISSTDGGYSYYQKDLSDLEDDINAENKRLRKNAEERESNLEQAYRNDIRKRDAQTEKTVDQIRQKNSEQLADDKAHSRAEVERAKQDTYDKYGRASRELDFEKRKAMAAVDEAKQNYEAQRQRDQEALTHRDANHKDDVERRVATTIAADRKSHQRETDELREKISGLIEDDRQKMDERARSNSLIRDKLEREMSLREKSLQATHENELSKVKNDSEQMESIYAAKNGQNIRDRDAYYAGVVRAQNEANTERAHSDENAYQRALDQQHLLMKKENANHEYQLERLHQKEDLARTQALQTQANTNREDLARQKEDYESQINRLNNEINDRDLRGADGKGPASLEQRIYNNLTDKYENLSREQVARDTRRTDHLHQTYMNQLQSMNQEHEAKLTQANRQFAAERSADNQVFVDHSYEMEQMNKLALENKDEETSRQSDQIRRTYGNMIERQRRDYENVLQQSRDEATTKFKSYRQDSAFSAKMAQRNFASQQNQTIRGYEKKLADQKTTYEDQIDTLKSQIAVVTRDGERRMQRALDEQQRGYEQKIAQMEYQNKERERILTQNYEDQIEKIKRANALLIQKKS